MDLLPPAPGPDDPPLYMGTIHTDAGIPYDRSTDGSGPGWSWMVVYGPWRIGGATAKFRKTVFHEADDARTDLQWLLDAAKDSLGLGNGPKVFKEKARNGDLILTCGVKAVFALYRVDEGLTSPQAGTAFYNLRAVPLLSEPPVTGFMDENRPRLLYP